MSNIPIDDAGSSELPASRYKEDNSIQRFVEMATSTPESRERYETVLEEIRHRQVTLNQVRKAKDLTQATIGELLEMDQSEVSRLERRSDMLLSTLQNFIAAAGGELELIATFPDVEPVKLLLPTQVDDTPQPELAGE